MNLNLLDSYGFEVTSGLARCLDDRELYERLLELFMEDDTFPKAFEYFEKDETQELFELMHALKGACGNVAMNELYGALVPLVDLLRKKEGEKDDIFVLLSKVEKLYNRAKEGITQAGKE
ncbi:MAG: Hpt domain-containing protein [Eubacteriaceae bacterium]|jgi:HPt (histidine-containing phosphotransfer) domain-containing protein|nr:Hpt domain-containing protein [Eubacteriaceae bacterium]